MAQFTGLSDKQWQLLEPMIPIYPYVRRKGHLPADPRRTLNSICWILITGARWCDLPKGPQWGSRTASHRWLGIWLENGVLEKVLTTLQEIANVANMIDFERLSVDGFFSAGKGGGQDVEYGYKGKGMTSHVLADGQGNPLRITVTGAGGDERQQVKPLIKKNHPMDKTAHQSRENAPNGSRQRLRCKRIEGDNTGDENFPNDSLSKGRTQREKWHKLSREKEMDGREGDCLASEKISQSSH
jgi:transposase